jgi:hypothetical protein
MFKVVSGGITLIELSSILHSLLHLMNQESYMGDNSTDTIEYTTNMSLVARACMGLLALLQSVQDNRTNVNVTDGLLLF